MTHRDGIAGYLGRLRAVLAGLDVDEIDRFVQVLADARDEGRTLYLCGNGGSGATASHVTGDLMKGASYGMPKRFRAICLNDNAATLLAYANDVSYDDVFVEPLKNWLRPGDVVIGLSGSGNSRNVLKAIDHANENGGITVGLCGYPDGQLEKRAQVVVHPRVHDMQLAEDVHLILGHIVMVQLGMGCAAPPSAPFDAAP
jgi:D-sedoheptulose 7-phosphate isomerase